MNKTYLIYLIYILGASAWAQEGVPDSIKASRDSLILSTDSLFTLSPDSLTVPVHYGAKDRVRFDYQNRIIHLYGDAYIQYQTMDIRAAYIRVELKNNLAIAEPFVDSTGVKTGIPEFKEGEQSFKAQRIAYNFSTKKGFIEEIVTRESDLYIHGQVTKFISKNSKDSDGNDIIFNQNAIITTCDAEHPHYGIYSTRQKIVPDKIAVIGPSNVRIQGIPTPLWLPFGFFPITKKAKAGLIIPKEYTYDDRGFGLTNFGYYLPVSDHLDLKFIGDVFFKGSFRISTSGSYKKRYKYNGNFNLQFENRIQELPASYKTNINRPISLYWSHNQDASAHPYQSFGGNIQIETGGFSKLQYYDVRRSLQNILRSSLKYSLQIPNSPFNLTAALSHSQNLITKVVELSFPDVSFQMRSINPFKSKNPLTSTEKWYDRITTSYSAQFRNSVNTFDSILFTPKVLDDLRYGFRHGVDANASFKLLKYFSFNPSLNYDEEFSFFQQEIQLKDTTFLGPNGIDSIYGLLDTTISNRFNSFRTVSLSAGLSTQIFGQILSSKGWFRGIRHQMTPTISLNFSPDYHNAPFDYFGRVNTDTRPDKNEPREYIRFTNSPFGGFSTPSENFNVSFNLNNRVELKYFSKSDSSFKKIPLFENLSLSTNYNVSADSFNLSPIQIGGSNRFINSMITVYYGCTLDPYGRTLVDGKEKRSKSFALDQNQKLAILSNAFINTTFSASLEKLAELFRKPKSNATGQLPSLFELFNNFTLQYILNYRHFRDEKGLDHFDQSVHSLSIQGNIPLTKNWRVNLSNISYDLKTKSVQYPTLGLERDLHCWLMRFDWSPQFGYYTFFIGVKPGSLEFIRIPSNQAFTGASR